MQRLSHGPRWIAASAVRLAYGFERCLSDRRQLGLGVMEANDQVGNGVVDPSELSYSGIVAAFRSDFEAVGQFGQPLKHSSGPFSDWRSKS